MQQLFIYLLQVNLLLSLIFLSYHFLLRKLTYYRLNRFYLLMGAGYALFYPFIDFDAVRTVTDSTPLSLNLYQVLLFEDEIPKNGLTLMDLLLYGVGVVSCFFLLQSCFRLMGIFRIHRYSFAAKWKEFSYRDVSLPILPFSFFKYIYVHTAQYSQKELEVIFLHEGWHVKGLHTLDILCFEFLRVLCWYNPLVWLMRKAARQNLEFLTDWQVLEEGMNRQTYQYTLVRAAQGNNSRPLLGNTFSFKPLKNRMMMMNKKRSGKFQLGKYALLLPIFIFIGAGFTTTKAAYTIEQLSQKAGQTQWNAATPSQNIQEGPTQEVKSLVIIDGKETTYEVLKALNPDRIERVNILSHKTAKDKYDVQANQGVIEVTLKKGERVFSKDPAQESELVVKDKKGEGPLYHVDGEAKTLEEVQRLTPDQIESINVLKAPFSVEVFGEEGKNGVVLIELKEN